MAQSGLGLATTLARLAGRNALRALMGKAEDDAGGMAFEAGLAALLAADHAT